MGSRKGLKPSILGARDGAGDDGFTEAYFDASETGLSQQEREGRGRGVCIFVEERRRLDANPKQERTERLLPCLCESEGID